MKKVFPLLVFRETSESCETLYEKAVSCLRSECESCVTFVSRVTEAFRTDLKRLRNGLFAGKKQAMSVLFRMFRAIEHNGRCVSI